MIKEELRKGNVKEIIKKLKKENKVLPATTDCIFKSLFQKQEMRSILSYILSNIIDINEEFIYNNLTFKNTELAKDNYFEKGKITDLLIEVQDSVINLEMNTNKKQGTIIKNNCYHHKLASKATLKGQGYVERQIIQINFDCINRFDDRLIIKFLFRDEEGKYISEENFIKYHINMEKMKKIDYNKSSLSRFEKILKMMTEEDKEELKRLSKGDKELENMKEEICKMSEDEEMVDYMIELEEIAQKINAEEDRKEARKEGLKEGLEEGKKEGLKEGLEEGKKEGLKEGKKESTIEIAKAMLNKNFEIKTISEITNLSIEEIENLK